MTAIDYYIFVCYGFVSFSILEQVIFYRGSESLSRSKVTVEKSRKRIRIKLKKSNNNKPKKVYKISFRKPFTKNSIKKIRGLNRRVKSDRRVAKRLNLEKMTSIYSKSNVSLDQCSQDSRDKLISITNYTIILYPVLFILFNIIYFSFYFILV